MKMYLLQRQESNLLPLPYESNMHPPTPRCGLEKTSILTDGCRLIAIQNNLKLNLNNN